MKIKSLDCTLRDGGYVNNWSFTRDETALVLKSLCSAGVEIIEVGFISECKEADDNSTLFASIESVSQILVDNFDKEILNSHDFVVMANFGDYNFDQLPKKDDVEVDGIRVAFHKKDRKKIKQCAEKIISKGYQFFLQPMTTSKYTDCELLELISDVRHLDITAYYIVDSYGSLYPRDVVRLFHLFNNNVPEQSSIGFHSHNNFQLAFANTIELLGNFSHSSRTVVIDSTIFGMGRGAGNLNTELFLSYCNRTYNRSYSISPLLSVIDSCLEMIYKENFWGYSAAHYLSALYDCHPNYASHLIEKKRLCIPDIELILREIQQLHVPGFDKELVELIYNKKIALNTKQDRIVNIGEISSETTVVIIAPGISVSAYYDRIKSFAKDNNVFTIAVNHHPGFIDPDAYFFSNAKRLHEFEDVINNNKLWVTSDIDLNGSKYTVDFEVLNSTLPVKNDDSSILLLTLLYLNKVKEVKLVGLDGFSENDDFHHYSYHRHKVILKNDVVKQKNEKMIPSLVWLKSKMDLEFLTPSFYQSLLPLKVLGVIPARYHSSRFPGKPLAKINGIPMIKRTYDRVNNCAALDEIVVATDDVRIYDYCKSENINVMYTKDNHPTGTDRVAEIAEKLNFDLYVNIQGDEPVINDAAISLIVDGFKAFDGQYDVLNLFKSYDESQQSSANIIKVVCNNANELLYMSRLDVPFSMTDEIRPLSKQVCVYGFTRRALRQFANEKHKTKNEQFEDIEILRFLDMGFKVKMLEYSHESLAVDVPSDITRVEEYIES